MYFRTKRTGTYSYLQIVESYRDRGRVRQRVLATLGRLDALQQGGHLDALLSSGARFCQNIAVLDAHAAGKTEPVAVRRIGPDLVFGRLWEETGIAAVLKSLLAGRAFQFPVERAIYLTVLHRLLVSGSDRAAERWRESYRIPGTEELDLHQLYRAMAWLGSPLDDGEPEVLGSPRCTKDLIEEALFDGRRDLFNTVDLVFFDTTSIYFEGRGGETIGQRGHSKDSRPDLAQMIVGLALDAEGWPLCCEMWPGNTTDVKTLVPVVQRMKKRFGIQRVSIVADRGMISKPTLDALESKNFQCQYILGVRMRSTTEAEQVILDRAGSFQEVHPERNKSTDPSPLKVKEVQVDGRRYVVCINEEQRRKDAADREAIVAHLRQALKAGDKSLVGNKGYRKFIKTPEAPRFQVDEKKVIEDARYDGTWMLRTNLSEDTDAVTVAMAYKQLWMVESSFRSIKSLLETRPIFHKRDETIRGHVFCSYLAILLKRELERRLQEKEQSWEWAEIVRGLDNVHEVEARFQGKRFALRSQLQGQAGKAFAAAGVALPPSLRSLD